MGMLGSQRSPRKQRWGQAQALLIWYELGVQLFPTDTQMAGRLLPEAVALVAVGGATGAVARWAIGTMIDTPPGVWPWPTLIVNLVGCALIGFAARRVQRGSLQWDFAVTGVLGGFTTMSAFAVELNAMVDAERTSLAVAYAVVTIAAGVGATLVAGSRAASEFGSADVDTANGVDSDEAGPG